MRPENTRVTRRERRRAWRGIPTGRRGTRQVRTTYGRHQRAWDRRERMSEALAALRTRAAEGAVSECTECSLRITLLYGVWTTDEGITCCYTDPAPEWTPHKPTTEGSQDA